MYVVLPPDLETRTLPLSVSVSLLPPVTVEQSDSLKAERDMYAALVARREALQEALRKKTEELKAICLQEGVSDDTAAALVGVVHDTGPGLLGWLVGWLVC